MNPNLVKLREHRKAKGLSMQALADKAGVNYVTVFRIEHAQGKRVGYTTLRKLSQALEMPVGELAYPPMVAEEPRA